MCVGLLILCVLMLIVDWSFCCDCVFICEVFVWIVRCGFEVLVVLILCLMVGLFLRLMVKVIMIYWRNVIVI